MQPQQMTSTRVSLSQRVVIVMCKSISLLANLYFRCGGDGEYMVRDNCTYISRLTSTPFQCRAVLHDPVMYPEPDSFKPERFINPDGSLRDDPVVTSLFGFGKRICPGWHLADATIFIVVASLLSVFNIRKGDGAQGGPDAYPFTGSGVRYGTRISLTAWERLERLTACSFVVVRPLSPARSPQETEKRKSLSSPIPRFYELLRLCAKCWWMRTLSYHNKFQRVTSTLNNRTNPITGPQRDSESTLQRMF